MHVKNYANPSKQAPQEIYAIFLLKLAQKNVTPLNIIIQMKMNVVYKIYTLDSSRNHSGYNYWYVVYWTILKHQLCSVYF